MPRAIKTDATTLPATPCLDEAAVLRFLDGNLPIATRVGARAHLTICGPCSELAVWVAADIANGDGNLGREGRPFIGQLPPGSRLARYEVLHSIGRGAMGEVYAAWDHVLGRRIALKVARVFDRATPEPQARLRREAQSLARVSHPNVVVLHDLGSAADRVFIAMQLLDGQTADVWLRTRRPGQQIVEVFVAAGLGLAAAHAANIVHRDFKPENVMIEKDGVVRLLDFSLARFDGEAAPTVEGTPRYMAPEQTRGGPASVRSDQFTFCAALRDALGGMRCVPEGRRRPARPVAPPRVLRALRRGLRPDPGDRFDSMLPLLAALSMG
jgi:eukaryotic-like serine/threonine-protein kinase